MQTVLLKNIGKSVFQGITDIYGVKKNIEPGKTIEIDKTKAIHLRNSYPSRVSFTEQSLKESEISDDWKLQHIPKKAYFYWGNKILPWLRMMSFVSFSELNLEWEVSLYIPSDLYSGSNTWKTGELSYQIQGKDYFAVLKEKYPQIKIIKFDFNTIGVKPDLPEVFKADFLRFYLLSTQGGIWCDSDIIFFKPMADFEKNQIKYTSKKLFLCFNNGYHSCGFLMSSENNEYFKKAYELSKSKFNITNYQGVFINVLETNQEVLSRSGYENINMDTVYPINSFYIDKIFNSDNSNCFTTNTIGLHWYGGHKLAEKYINELTEKKYDVENTLGKALKIFFNATKENHFKIITAVRNSDKYIEKCIKSVLSQKYTQWKMIIIDDCSTDETGKIADKYKSEKIEVIHNTKRTDKLTNIMSGIANACNSENDIIVMLDGDDWLSGDFALSYLNRVYNQDDIWITYGQFEPASKKYSNFCRPIDVDTYRKNRQWLTSHLKTFKVWLFNKIDLKDFLDNDGHIFHHADDVAFMLPMLEMAGNKHIKFIDKVLYVYNDLNPNCDMNNFSDLQEKNKKAIFDKLKYEELDKPKVSILITTFKRTHLLKWNLLSLSRQDLKKYNIEIVILDDYQETKEIKDLIKSYEKVLNIVYINTGKNKKILDEWRTPGYAFNVGVKHCQGDYIILTCAEIFSLNNTVQGLIEPLLKSKKILTVPDKAKDDIRCAFLESLESGNQATHFETENYLPLNVALPFFMGMSKEDYCDINGYDEDFTLGIAREDDDFVGRLVKNGCKYNYSPASIVHLYHDRIYNQRMSNPEVKKRVEYNDRLFKERKDIIKRNLNKEWGKL